MKNNYVYIIKHLPFNTDSFGSRYSFHFKSSYPEFLYYSRITLIGRLIGDLKPVGSTPKISWINKKIDEHQHIGVFKRNFLLWPF
jgi:hypothetical protein